ncbi:MAG: asparagine synthase (glutamine-hydrolyzing) [Hyphomicrobiaceae bacterium]|nr:asparagine synthase (glutamine-hydrolyzing) [Hyphomicrobiaceae bacterium]
MCGIAGILHFGRMGDAPNRVNQMATSMVHRGPDDDGFWSDNDIALGFRRLSIIDLESGAQPMTNEDGTIWVVFNGEIYNHRELRRDLEGNGHRFSSDHSDTEVLVHGYEEWGERLPERLNGMFAFAVWDQTNRQLLLARDRLGIKPLYLAQTTTGVLFSSEIRALFASGLVARLAEPVGVFEYFQQQNLWSERSMFSGVSLMKAGSAALTTPRRTRNWTYWDFKFDRNARSLDDCASSFREILGGTLRRQVAADVPVMTYLSGGIDSSAITARAHREDSGVRAYSCLFDLENVGEDRLVDEREFSRAVATELDIDHIELELAQDDLKSSLLPTVAALEEPRMGMAYVNYRIAQRVAKDSKVVLSGCGGDEIVGGYVARYAYVQSQTILKQNTSRLSELISRLLKPQKATSKQCDPFIALYSYPVPEQEFEDAFTPSFLSEVGDYRMRDSLGELLKMCPSDDPWDQLLYVDAKTYLHGLLVIEDKLSMAHSLETRVPLLDNEVIDFALTCPWETLTDGQIGKIVFREAIRDWVPEIVADKPKMGFGPPDASWYRGALQEFIREALSRNRIHARGIFNPEYVERAIEEHMNETANRIPLIWSLLSFEAWCEAFDLYGGSLGEPLAHVA